MDIDKLNSRQRMLVIGILACETVKDAQRQALVSDATLNGWLSSDADFRTAYVQAMAKKTVRKLKRSPKAGNKALQVPDSIAWKKNRNIK